MRYWKKNSSYLLLLVFIFVFLSINLKEIQAALVIDPGFIRLKLNEKRNSGTFVLKNTGDVEERYRAKAIFFTHTLKGGFKEIPDGEYSLSSWIKFNPQEFVLPPKSSRVVRYSIIPQGKLKPYEYYGAIQFVPLSVAHVKSNDGKGHSVDIKVVSIVIVPIYGYVKGTKYSAQLKSLDIKKEDNGSLVVNAIVVNTGDGVLRLNGKCQFISDSGETAAAIDIKQQFIFPKEERIVKIKIKEILKPDKYAVKFYLKSTDSNSDVELKKESKFEL